MRRELRNLELFSHNAQGLYDDKFEELLAFMRKSDCFAFAVHDPAERCLPTPLSPVTCKA